MDEDELVASKGSSSSSLESEMEGTCYGGDAGGGVATGTIGAGAGAAGGGGNE